MKFSCNQQILSKAINTVSKAVTNRTTIPILKGILLTTKNGELILTTSDLDLSIEKSIPAQIEEEGQIVVLSKIFGDIIRKLPNEEITFTLMEDNNIKIECLHSCFNIICFPSDEFPSIGQIEEENQIVLNRELFKDMIRRTSFAASIDESKGVIVGVLMELEHNCLNMVAIDGFRLAFVKENIINEQENKIIIHSKIINEINKIISEVEDEEIGIIFDNKKAIINLDKTKIVLRLLEGQFIKYNDVLPKVCNTKVYVNRSEFLESIERASLFSKEGKNNLIKLSTTGESIIITSRSEEGNVKEEIASRQDGENLDIGFNSKYLIDMLKVIEDETIMLEFNTSVSPCMVKPLEGEQFAYLLLPVRLNSN